MSALAIQPRAEHPNVVDAREHRRNAISHAARSLFRDPDWLDPDGDLAVWSWLCEIPYTKKPKWRSQFRAWLHNAHITDGSTPIAALTQKQRNLLVLQMSRFAKAAG